MKKLYELLGGRKATFGILLFVIALVMVFTNTLNGSEWLEYTKWIFGAFVVGNGLSYACSKGNCKKE
jgi:hypothetical protein